jgi:long-chain acyl-CoA synthetase
MEKIWLKNYQRGVPESVEKDLAKYDSIPQLLEESFKKYQDLPAFHCMGKTLTYKEIDILSLKFASFLQNEAGLKKGDRVALMMPNILQYPIALFGILRGGFVAVNVNPLYTARELEHQLSDSGATAIIIFENAGHTLAQIIAKSDLKIVMTTAIGDMLSFPKSVIVNFVIKHIKKMVPSFAIPHSKNFNNCVNAGDEKKFVNPHFTKSDLAFLQYTGGTTGVAKGAMLTHQNIVANMCQARAWISPLITEREEIIITPLPLYHIFSLTANCFVFSSIGALNILITNPRDMKSFVKELKKWKFTAFTGVNTLFNGLLNQAEFSTVDFSSLKLTLGGGMAVQKSVAEKWKEVTGKALIEAYGLTETSPAACINPMSLSAYNGSIGLPICSTEVSLKNDAEADVALGEVGEICIKGPQVMLGYWKRDDETKNVFSHDGFLKTGDLGIMDASGFIKIVDRKKDMIIVSGFKVFPTELEEVVSGHPKVFETAVIGIPDDKTGEAVKLFIVKKDQSLTSNEIIQFCQEQVTNYKIPRVVEFRDELPKSNVGKILRKDLR